MRPIPARHLLDMVSAVAGRNIITATVGPNAEPIVLSLEQTPDYRDRQPGSAVFPKNRADHLNHFHLQWQIDSGIHALSLPPTHENFHFVQPFGSDQWLLIRSRAEDAADRNAHVFDGAGKMVRSFHAGDGIQDVQTTRDRQIWVSYFDEGVFGDLDLGRAGCVCFDDYGQPTLEFSSIAEKCHLSPIDDCYAMNVASDEDVWLYYYSDFPLVRLRRQRFDHQWPNIPVEGSGAFAVTEDRALFAGSYANRHGLFLVSLTTMDAEGLCPLDDTGQPVKLQSACGRGTRLYLGDGRSLFIVDLNDL